ncbi:MAG: hypothetical protein ICV84_15605 [Flavisolibacter sp.]|nr:hypothetical protein [Flavisolibacter sp.]
MRAQARIWIVELVWIVVILIFTFTIHFLIFGQFSALADTIDIQLHDTYFVIGGIEWVVAIFTVLGIVTYSVKGGFQRFGNWLGNVILSLLIIALLLLILQWQHLLLMIGQTPGGWTVYPPLNALPNAAPIVPNQDIRFWVTALVGLQALLWIALFLLGFQTGRLKK